jgi:selenium-binding protein 1
MPETTDPTLYRSPADAIAAPPERLAYVAAYDPAGQSRDAMTAIDTDPSSADYGKVVVGWSELPTAGNELHHFGWNACSSALCHQGHGDHGQPLERRYLIVSGLRSSRVYVMDTTPDLRSPQVVRTIEADELASKAGYSRPHHTLHCGPGAIFMSSLGGANGNDGPGGIALLDHDTFDVIGGWELDRGDQYLAYDVWWHLNHDTLITSEWGTPSMVENGLNPEDLLGRKFGHHLNFWSMSERKLTQRIDLGDQHQMVLELRPAHDPSKTWGFVGGHQRRGPVGVGVAVAPRRRPVGGAQGDHHPRRAGRRRRPAAGAAAVRRGAAAGLRHRPVGRRPLAVRVLLGYWRAEAVRRERPLQPARDRLGQARRHRAPPAAPGGAGHAAPRRPPDGGGQPRRQAGLRDQLAVRRLGRDLLPGGRGRLDGQAGRRPGRRRHRRRPAVLPQRRRLPGLRVHQTRLQAGDASSDSYCYTS